MMKSVLIADDNAFVRQRLRELFSREPGFDVCAEAENGRKAVEQAQDTHPDLILLDLSMPVMNGLDAARALKRLIAQSSDRHVQHPLRSCHGEGSTFGWCIRISVEV